MDIRKLVHELFEYVPETGILVRKVSRGPSKKGSVAGFMHNKGYIRIRIGNEFYLAHRVIWLMTYGKWPDGEIDHINHDRSDNRLENLRDVSRATNQQNRIAPTRGNKTSGYLGVHWSKCNNKYVAKIGINGGYKHLGLFDDPKMAHEAYLTAKRQLHEGNIL